MNKPLKLIEIISSKNIKRNKKGDNASIAYIGNYYENIFNRFRQPWNR